MAISDELITIDHLYKYRVERILEGGMGRVLLLSLVADRSPRNLIDLTISRSAALQRRFKYPYRESLAAKTVLQPSAMATFKRECALWLEFNEKGVVPLLKVVSIGDQVLALMPRYSGSLRDLLTAANHSPQELLRAFLEPITALSTLHHHHGVVHQDIKPENLLYDHQDAHLALALSDWGIANVQATLLDNQGSPLSQFAMATMGGFGTLPYMAPERFSSYMSNIRADIFSLGMVFIEILSGHLPYSPKSPIADQLVSGQYYYNAQAALINTPRRTSRLLLSMIHPTETKRPHDYATIISFLRKL